MAEGQNTPTFKLVLVGDGGTGKVSERIHEADQSSDDRLQSYVDDKANLQLQTDHLRQAPSYGRV